ncbi:MAG: diphosphomevalonate decarboxylase [Anaerolineae bacterium]
MSTEVSIAASATACAHPNLALVKYWGQLDPVLNLPANSSISLNLSGAITKTTVRFARGLESDQVMINGAPPRAEAHHRVCDHLDRVRTLADISLRAEVVSTSDFPSAVGFASSSSAFAALSLAAATAAGLDLDERELSILARKGSGSACRSVPDGFVEWVAGRDDQTSYARQLLPGEYWDLHVITVVWETGQKSVSSTQGHRVAPTSPFYSARLERIGSILEAVRSALIERDFATLGMTAEREAMSLHAVAMTSRVKEMPWMSGIYYLSPQTLGLMLAVQRWRRKGLRVYFTLDAGPTVHLLCEGRDVNAVVGAVEAHLQSEAATGADIVQSTPGRGAWLCNKEGGAMVAPPST